MTGETNPILLTIYDDGRFETDMPMSHPQCSFTTINDYGINIYLEPGKILSMIIDSDEFLQADRVPNKPLIVSNIELGGSLAQINNELVSIKLEQYNSSKFIDEVKLLTPEDF